MPTQGEIIPLYMTRENSMGRSLRKKSVNTVQSPYFMAPENGENSNHGVNLDKMKQKLVLDIEMGFDKKILE